MKIVCPNDKRPESPDETFHKHFYVTFQVLQQWKVNQFGELEFATNNEVNVTQTPTASSVYTCCTCGAIAEVREKAKG